MDDYYAAHKEFWRMRHANNFTKSSARLLEFLKAMNLEYTFIEATKQYTIFIHGSKAIDFWPTTGAYFNRLSKKRGRGIMNVLNEIRRSL